MNRQSSHGKYAKYHAAVRYLEGLGNIYGGYRKTNLKSHPRPKMFLERMRDFLDEIGNPEKGFKYVHITGTAGKGSVAAAVHSALVKAGKKAGLFTSPFAVSTIEKIQVGKKYIDPLAFADIVEELKPSVDRAIEVGRHGAPSYFELMFAIALLYFKREKCEFVVLEVGLGGRYDATNVIKKPLITAITNIGLDHTEVLGSTKREIANDKAGIIKKDSVFFTTEEDPGILEIFRKNCKDTGAKFHSIKVTGLDYIARNRFLAGAICAELGIIDDPEKIGALPQLPARFEIIQKRPLVVIDGAHNPSKIESVIHNLKNLEYRKLFLVIAASADKDWKEIVRIIVPYANEVYATRFGVPGRQSVSPGLLSEEVKKYARRSCAIRLYSDPIQAFIATRRKASKDDAILVTGSFYLAGDILGLYRPEDEILARRDSGLRF